MQVLKMRLPKVAPDQDSAERQQKTLIIINNMKRGGYGWEDILLELKKEKLTLAADQIRNFVLRPRS